MVLDCGQGTNARFKLDMSSYLIALHRCHVLLVIYMSFGVILNSPVDCELGGDRQNVDYTAVPYSYPTQEGKRSPTSLIPVFQSILPAYDSNIFCCSYSCMWYLPTIPFHCSQHEQCRLIAHCQSCSCCISLAAIIYGRGIIPGGKQLILEY